MKDEHKGGGRTSQEGRDGPVASGKLARLAPIITYTTEMPGGTSWFTPAMTPPAGTAPAGGQAE
ncbi:MAG: hypothetical protein JXQ27_16395 [Acidobacteria bacterium]|nr:hypothetical protein [Acidobacteriota bacterium]